MNQIPRLYEHYFNTQHHFGKINLKSKFEQDFLKELFDLLPSIRGRFNFCNFGRYSKYNELTFRRHFSKFFDWLSFNFALIELALSKANSPCLAIIDANFIAKSGKKTFGGADILRNVLKKIEKSQDELKQIIDLIVGFASLVFEICLKRTILEVQVKNVM